MSQEEASKPVVGWERRLREERRQGDDRRQTPADEAKVPEDGDRREIPERRGRHDRRVRRP